MNTFSRIKIYKKFILIRNKFNFSTKEKEPDDMKAFYDAIKNKLEKIREEENPNPKNLIKIWNFKNTIAWTLSSFILYYHGKIKFNKEYNFFSGLFFIGALIKYYKDSKLDMIFYVMIDQFFSLTRNKKIFFGYEVVKEFIFKHPEIKPYFQDKNSILFAHVWAIFDSLNVGKGFVHDENLSHRRYVLHSKLINLTSRQNAKIEARILYFTPSEFEIEYLRIDLEKPFYKKITIIDGRREMKNWVDELEEGKINKNTFSKYRDEENIKY